MDEFILGLISFSTSTIAGIVGLGGGFLLLAVLPSFLPLTAIIPIHGLVQLVSNVSRAYFGYQHIQYHVIPKFLIGSFIGVSLFSFLLYIISLKYIPIFIGIYILLSLWSKKFNEKIKNHENYYIIGFLQTGLSVIVGTTGPLTITLLLKDFQDKNKVITTAAVLMSITHILKIIVYFYFGFFFTDYLYIILAMITGSIIGSYFGTKIRGKIDGKRLVFVLKIFLTIIAIKSLGNFL